METTASHPVSIGVIANSAPACYLDTETGEYVGIFLDILDAVCERTGLNVVYVPLDLTQGAPVAQLRQGKAQLVAGILKSTTFTQDASLSLTQELLDDTIVLVGRRGEDFTQNAEERIIALPAGFQVALEYVSEQFPTHTIEAYPTARDCLDAVRARRADATLYMRTSMNYILQDPHYDALEIIPAYSRDVETCAVALSPENDMLISIVDKGLAMISDNEHASILMNFTIRHPYEMTLRDVLYKYRVFFAIIAVLFAALIAALLSLNAYRRTSNQKLRAAYEQEQAAHEQKKEALVIAQKASAAKGSFMSRMSHEIRTPLNAVIGYNTIARNEMTKAKTDADRRQADMKVMDCLMKSETASKHLLTIINDVLDMSAIESGRIRIAHDRFDFKSLISSLTFIFYSQAKAKGVNFEVLFGSFTEEWFVGDQMRINQVLANLLSNAIKFTAEGGSVQLLISQPEAQTNAAHVHFEVRDTGIGMRPEYLEHIWTPFEQADMSIARRYGGTGLGLSITKTLVDLMGGSITVKSELGAGTEFAVDLTFERTEQPSAEKTYDFNNVHALVVDDDVNTCDYVELLLARCGARCETVASGPEAVAAYQRSVERNDRFTVCLIDWHMPQMDGLDTVKAIRRIAGDEVPLIIITAYDFTEIADEAGKAGVSLFISKPLFQSSLFDLLANISGTRAPVKVKQSVAYDFAGERVLLAEDNAMNMEVAKKVLSSVNLTVDTALNGEQAVQMFTAAPEGSYKVILMDVQMPEMDGHEATRLIRASAHPEARTIPIIAMTADAFAENVQEALAAGMNDHIAKPIDMAKLFKTLGRYIENRNG